MSTEAAWGSHMETMDCTDISVATYTSHANIRLVLIHIMGDGMGSQSTSRCKNWDAR